MSPEERDPEEIDEPTDSTRSTEWKGPGPRPESEDDPEVTRPLEGASDQEVGDTIDSWSPEADPSWSERATRPAGGLLAGHLLGARSADDEDHIGPYRILRKLGEGGMGTVFLAEQREPVRRRVALKCVKLGMDTREVVRRFQSERQAVALMDHPGIAKVFDAGSTSEGRPYFVMEYVPGEPLTDFCDGARLSNRERLVLFIDICRAIQHAHQKGVIHRDLKPSNILVSRQDGVPVPKVIDFGIAKAIHQPIEAQTELTRQGQMMGTPAYMSPEQASEGMVDVDTRSDIYSLGVLLYRLLVGQLPYDLEALRRGGFSELRRLLAEEEPQRPSTRFAKLGDSSTTLAELRGGVPLQIVRQLRGDLDWITMKAMHKDRGERYQSASELAADIERHLKDEPVSAGPPTMAYRLRKLIRRRKGAMLAALAVTVTLITGLVVSWSLYRQAESSRQSEQKARRAAESAEALERASREQAVLDRNRAQNAERLAAERLQQVEESRQRELLEAERVLVIKDFLLDMFRSADPGRNGRRILVVEILAQAAARLAPAFVEQPLLRATLAGVVGRTFLELGLVQEAEALIEDAYDLLRLHLGPDAPETLAAANRYTEWLKVSGRLLECERLTADTYARCLRVLGEEDRETGDARRQRADILRRLSRFEEAEDLARSELAMCERLHGPDDRSTLDAVHQLASVLKSRGRREEAESLARRAWDSFGELLGAGHPDTLGALGTLANLVNELGRAEEAEPLYRQLLEQSRDVLGDAHRNTLNAMHGLALFLRERKELVEADELLVAAIEGCQNLFGLDHHDTARFLDGLASVRMSQMRPDAAEELYRQALGIRRRVLGERHRMTAVSMDNLAGLLRQRADQAEEAESLMRQALDMNREVLGPEHPDTLVTTFNLGTFLSDKDRFQESLPYFDELLRRASDTFGAEHPYLKIFSRKAGFAFLRAGRTERAAEILEPLHAALVAEGGENDREALRVLKLKAELYERQGKTAKAQKAREILRLYGQQ